MSNLFAELKRRNVFKVATAYVVVGWLTIQVTESLAPRMALPEWVPSLIILLLLAGLPIALIFAWAFELTPEGIKKSKEVDVNQSITQTTSRKIDLIIIGALVLLVGGMAFTGKFTLPDTGSKDASAILAIDKSIAVLPFVNMSSDPEQDYFSDGLTEEILNSLAMLPELQVTARTSSFHFKGQNIPVPEIAKKLGVAHVVEGSVRRGGDTLRITAQLILASDGSHLWSNTYDRSVKDVLDVQRDVAESIAQALDVVLDAKRSQEMFASGTRNVEAFEAYHKGLAYSTSVHSLISDKNLWDANIYFAQAIAADPKFAAPHQDIQDAYEHYLMEGANSQFLKKGEPEDLNAAEALRQLRFHQNKAIELANTPESKLSAEIAKAFESDDWQDMPRMLKMVRQNPSIFNTVTSSVWWIDILHALGEGELIVPQLQEEIVHSPYSRLSWYYLISHHLGKGNFEEAKKIIEQSKQYSLFKDIPTIELYILSGDQIKLKEIYDQMGQAGDYTPATLLAALGKKEETLLKISQEVQKKERTKDLTWAYYLIGAQDKANAIITEIDKRPLGALMFAQILLTPGKIHASKESAPNFVRKLRQAGIAEDKINAMFLPSNTETNP